MVLFEVFGGGGGMMCEVGFGIVLWVIDECDFIGYVGFVSMLIFDCVFEGFFDISDVFECYVEGFVYEIVYVFGFEYEFFIVNLM